MFDKDRSPKEFEALSKAITDAIMQSSEVRKIISQILRENRSLSNNLLVLIMKLEILKGGPRSRLESHKGLGTHATDTPNRSTKKGTLVEGEKLSPEEAAFLDYCSKIFDEEKWLKEHKLLYPEEETDS